MLIVVSLIKGSKQLYGQNRLLIIYDDKRFEPSCVVSRFFCINEILLLLIIHLVLKGRKKLYGQNRLLIIYDDKWFELSYVASKLFCTCLCTIPLYGKTCVRGTLHGEVLAHPRSRCGMTLRCRYLGEFGICRYVGRRF